MPERRVRRAACSAAEALEGRVLLSGAVYTITPPITATGDVPDKALVADLPAGRYVWEYVNGAHRYWGDERYTTMGHVFGTAAGQQVTHATDDWAVQVWDHPTQAAAELAGAGTDAVFDWAGGEMYAWLRDSYYPDNLPGSPSTTFRVYDPIDLVVGGIGEETGPAPHELDPGAFVPLNDDFDEPAPVSGTAPLPDHQTPAAHAGDDELVNAELHLTVARFMPGTWSLSFPAGVNVYRANADGTVLTPVASGVQNVLTSQEAAAGLVGLRSRARSWAPAWS